MTVISYKCDDKTQLSPHFNVQKFHYKLETVEKPKEYDRDGIELIDASEYAPI